MDIITITPEQIEIVIQIATSKALNIKQATIDLPDRGTFKEALEIAGLSKSLLYEKTMSKAIPFSNRLIFSSKELKGWVAEQLEMIVTKAINEASNIKSHV
jgi:hypothetical protein